MDYNYKLNKLKINSEKLMKNEELLTLSGGYGGACCWWYTYQGGGGYHLVGTTGPSDCNDQFKYVGYDGYRSDC